MFILYSQYPKAANDKISRRTNFKMVIYLYVISHNIKNKLYCGESHS